MAHSRADFLARFGGVYGPWIAEAVWPRVESGEIDRLGRLSAGMREAVEAASRAAKLALIRAQGGHAAATRAAVEPGGSAEREAFERLHAAYQARFGFPFILATKGLAPHEILAALERRLANDPAVEFETALAQIHRIAGFRLADIVST